MDKPKKTAAEKEMIELLATLIDQYEESIWPTPKASPGDILKFLLDECKMSQSELAARWASRNPRSPTSSPAAGNLAKPTCLA